MQLTIFFFYSLGVQYFFLFSNHEVESIILIDKGEQCRGGEVYKYFGGGRGE